MSAYYTRWLQTCVLGFTYTGLDELAGVSHAGLLGQISGEVFVVEQQEGVGIGVLTGERPLGGKLLRGHGTFEIETGLGEQKQVGGGLKIRARVDIFFSIDVPNDFLAVNFQRPEKLPQIFQTTAFVCLRYAAGWELTLLVYVNAGWVQCEGLGGGTHIDGLWFGHRIKGQKALTGQEVVYIDVSMELFKTVIGENDQRVFGGHIRSDFADCLVDFPEVIEEEVVVLVGWVLIGVPQEMHEPIGAGKNEHENLPVVVIPKIAVGIDSCCQRLIHILEELVDSVVGFLGIDIETVV